jgi:hypothetical protein
MFGRAPTARSGQIIFDHGRLDSIQSKTFAEYGKQKSDRQDQYQKAKEK